VSRIAATYARGWIHSSLGPETSALKLETLSAQCSGHEDCPLVRFLVSAVLKHLGNPLRGYSLWPRSGIALYNPKATLVLAIELLISNSKISMLKVACVIMPSITAGVMVACFLGYWAS